MTDRRHISMKTKLASALLTIRVEENGKLVPFIDHETAKQLTAAQIISLFHFDHYPIPVWADGTDEPWNLVPKPIMDHRIKTAKYDTPASAKADRVTAAQREFQRKMLAKAGQDDDAPSQLLKRGRPMPGSKASGWRKRMDGTVERR